MKKNRHIITIAGDLASGKGTVSTLLKEDLGYIIYRNGDYVRNLAKEKGMDITNFNIYLTTHPEIDLQIEKSAAEYAKENDNLVIDARLGWYAVPHSFKVYLKVDIDTSAKRAFFDPNRKTTEKFDTLEDQKQDIIKRFNLENERYFTLYGIRKDDMSNYDLVIDTTFLTPIQVKDKIKVEYDKWLKISM
ncbi:MAG: AAA family ATPase [Clostridia bacterium]|nr:AAA family ATPase [Clostridia bacterium]